MPPIRRSTAYHEAGHAALYFFFRRKFKYLTVEPTGEAVGHLMAGRGRIPFIQQLPSLERLPSWIDVRLMISLAGEVAQRRGSPHSIRSYHARGDQQKVAEWLQGLNCPGEKAYLDYCRARLERTFRDPIIWAGVEVLVDALMEQKTICYEHAKRIFLNATDAVVLARSPGSARTTRKPKLGD